MQAAQTDEISMMKFLIQKGADVNKQEFGNNWTPLIWATYSGYPKAVKVLLDNGAKVDLLSKESYTALVYAAKVSCVVVIISNTYCSMKSDKCAHKETQTDRRED